MTYSFYYKHPHGSHKYAVIQRGILSFTFQEGEATQWDSLQDMIIAISHVQLPDADFIITMKGKMAEFQEIDPSHN